MRRETRAMWRERVGRWDESGLSGREFAREEGVSEGTLRHGRWRLGAEAGERHAKRGRGGLSRGGACKRTGGERRGIRGCAGFGDACPSAGKLDGAALGRLLAVLQSAGA